MSTHIHLIRWICFTGEALLRIPVFAKAIEKCDAALAPFGIDVRHVITNKDKTAFDDIMNSFVGIAAVQVLYYIILGVQKVDLLCTMQYNLQSLAEWLCRLVWWTCCFLLESSPII